MGSKRLTEGGDIGMGWRLCKYTGRVCGHKDVVALLKKNPGREERIVYICGVDNELVGICDESICSNVPKERALVPIK